MPLTRDPRPAQGTLFQGGYEIVGELGGGTSGVVYKARQLSTGQDVAIKILAPSHGRAPADSVSATERFRREMRLCSELFHPNIVPLIDSGESDDGLLYAVFQYVPGSTLKDVLASEDSLALSEAVHLMAQVLDALSCAHARGIVHRDLKPENIMITKTGARRNALVLDFGLGGFAQETRQRSAPRITATQEMMGTPCYAAPEQLRGEPPSTRSDLYSWGLIFLECLTGELAVSGGSPQDVILKQLGPEPVPIPSSLSDRRLRHIFEAVTAKPVEKRDVTSEGLLHALAAVTHGAAPAPTRAADTLPEGERRQLTIASCGLTVVRVRDDAVDLEELDELLHAQHAIFAEITARNGGQVAGVLADRVLLAFGFPHAQENDARRAARTALQLVAEVARRSARLEAERGLRLELRAGLHTGVVVARELRQGIQSGLYDLVGLTPQIAARLEALAAPGEVLLSPETQRLLRGDLGATPAGEHTLPGLPDRVAIYALRADERPPAPRDTFAAGQQTPVVGRREQVDLLTARWQHAVAGRGSAVLIVGEPGIGKSRLARELRRHVPRDAWLECRCVAESAGTPLRPLADLLLGLDASLAALLERYGFDLAQTLPLFVALCGLPPDDRFAPLALSPERRKELTLTALASLFARIAEERPIVLAIEDLHWADPTTIELVTLLVQELRSTVVVDPAPSARIVLLLTARPEFAAPWPGEDVALLPLSRLERGDVEAMVRAGAGSGDPVPAAVLDEIVRRADGIPLFVEEVTRVLVEAGVLAAGADAEPDAAGLEIPSTLRDLLMARLDGLSFGARETAQLAAVLGREFRYEVLRAVARKHESVLRDDLRELTDAGLAYHRRSARSEAYVFKHALVRDVAYETMLRSTQQSLHNRVANTLRERFPEIERQRPELIALHYESSDQPELAIAYWKRAGDRTMARGTYAESTRHFERGLALLGQLPESRERLEQELGLVESLGTALLATRGYSAPEVEAAFARAARLCERLGGEVPIRVLHGIWSAYMNGNDAAATARLIPIMERLAQTSRDPVELLTAHANIGVRAFFSGDFVTARDEMARATTWYGTAGYKRFIDEYGYDGGLYAHAYLMWSLWILGDTEHALTVRDEMLALAEAGGTPYGLAIALGFAINMAHAVGDAEDVVRLADRDLPFLQEQKLYFWLGPATCTRGWAAARLGDADTGIAQIQFGLSLLDAVGMRLTYPYHLSLLAEVQLGGGALDDGLATVDRALALASSDDLLDRFYTAELHRLRGELRLAQRDRVAAETCFRAALAVARDQRAKAFELRAATGLARLLADGGQGVEARALLAEACDWFRDRLATPDVRAARTLRADLHEGPVADAR